MHMSSRTLALAGLALAACASRSAERTMAPAEAEADVAGPAEIDALEAELAAREDQLRALGAAPQGGSDDAIARDAPSPAGGDRATAKVASKAVEARPEAEGAAAPMESSAAPARLSASSGRCVQVCDLTAAICELRDNICRLAPSHPDEPRYQRACDRATVDCTTATEACDACA